MSKQKSTQQKTAPASRKQLDDVDLTVRAGVVECGLHLRRSLATAELEDGRKVEVDLNADGTLLVTMRYPDREGYWKTYTLAPRSIVDAVLKVEDA